MPTKNKVPVVHLLTCHDVQLDCPECGAQQEGFIGNPAGGHFNCDECGADYRVNPDADIEFG